MWKCNESSLNTRIVKNNDADSRHELDIDYFSFTLSNLTWKRNTIMNPIMSITHIRYSLLSVLTNIDTGWSNKENLVLNMGNGDISRP